MTEHNNKPFPWKPFLALFGAGLAGILSLMPFIRQQIETVVEKAPEPPKMSRGMMVVMALWQSAVFLALAIYGGVKVAPGLGLRSHLAAWAANRPLPAATVRKEGPWALLGGLLTPLLIMGGERLFRPWTGESLRRLEEAQPRSLSLTVMGLLYGGITEELLMRWGLTSLLARLLQRLQGKSLPAPAEAGEMAGAIGLSSLLFGVGHLPALASMVTLTPALVLRTILLNAAGGMVFGFLFWKQSLEAAMLAHSGSHLVMGIAEWVRRRKEA